VKIIFISKTPYFDDTIRNQLHELSEKDSIAFFYSYSDASDFINNNIIKNKTTVDLIITENNIKDQKATDFIDQITADRKRTFSNLDFNFHTIPTFIVADEKGNENISGKSAFYDVITNTSLEKLNLYVPKFISSIKTWRKYVLDELDNLGVKFNSGKIDYEDYFSNQNKANINTKILSENFKNIPRKLKYDWIYFNDKQIEKAIDLYIKELKYAIRFDKKKNEKRFHAIFNKYPFFLKRDNYSQHWYEPKLYYENSKYYEPDYSLRPNFSQKTDLSILEIKLPAEEFIKKTRFHPKPYSSIINHIFQVNDYKEYLESEEYYKNISDVFGFTPKSIEYNILIGRLEDKISGKEVLDRRLRQMNATHINFITYDELLEYQVKYLKRMNILNIR